jgi:hypothetical protein
MNGGVVFALKALGGLAFSGERRAAVVGGASG